MQNSQLSQSTATKKLVRTAIIAAIYAALTIIIYPLSYGPIQFRVSEALTILPLLLPESVIGLTLGCLISNFFGNGLLDVIIGTLATLTAGVLTSACRAFKSEKNRIALGIIPPVVINAILIPFTYLAITELKAGYVLGVLTVGMGQIVVLLVLGIPLYQATKRLNLAKKG